MSSTRKEILCDGCDAVFRLAHNMDEWNYAITYCPFCSEPLETENEDSLFDEEEDEDY